MTAPADLAFTSYMTDTTDLGVLWRQQLRAPVHPPTVRLHLLDLPPRPDEAPAPAPQRLPKRLRRRRAMRHVAAAWRAATLTRACLAASTAGLALTGCGVL
jgi:hypothetical protein